MIDRQWTGDVRRVRTALGDRGVVAIGEDPTLEDGEPQWIDRLKRVPQIPTSQAYSLPSVPHDTLYSLLCGSGAGLRSPNAMLMPTLSFPAS